MRQTKTLKKVKAGKKSKNNTNPPATTRQKKPVTEAGEINEAAHTRFKVVVDDLKQLADKLSRSAISLKDYGVDHLKPEDATIFIRLGQAAYSSFAALWEKYPEVEPSELRLFQRDRNPMD